MTTSTGVPPIAVTAPTERARGAIAPSRPILVLSASAGAGHMMAAEAIEAALRRLAPEQPVEVIDVLQLTNGFFRRLYAQGYLALVNHAPTAMGWLYEAMDRPDTRFRDGLRAAFQNLNTQRAMATLVARRPRLIVNTHFLSAEIVATLRRRGRLDCPQVTITTDFETHRLWVQQPTERYYTATGEGKAYLETWGVPAESIEVRGIPVRPAFEALPTRAAARAKLGLDADRPVVLLLCGGFGVGPTRTLFAGLLETAPDVQVVAITGQNERLRQQLAARSRGTARRIVVVGFTRAMHEYMCAADLVVTKPGGLTVSEALVCHLPLVVVNPIPGQEARNSDHLLERGAGIKVNNPRLLGYRVGRLLADADRLAALRQAAARLARPDAARAIAASALQLLAERPA